MQPLPHPSATSASGTNQGLVPRAVPPQITRTKLLRAGAGFLGLGLATSVGGGAFGGSNNGGGFWRGGGGGPPGGSGQGGPQELYQLGSAEDARRRNPKEPIMLTLVSFAVTKMAYVKLTRQFAKEFKERTGREVVFRLSFGGSGVQARAVMDGLPADLVALALPLDTDKIAEKGLMRKDWQKAFPNNSVIAESVVALVVREGNPKGIQTWDDLVKPGVEVICSNPKTAGVARWNFLAMWGHLASKGDAMAREYCYQVFNHVPVQPRDAREASDVFYRQRKGDVLITYENEVLLTNKMYSQGSKGGNPLPYIVPDNNVRIEMPIALVDANIDQKPAECREAAEEFVRFLFTPAAQQEFARWGFRPVDKGVAKECESVLPPIKGLWRVDERLGGWGNAQSKFFDSGAIMDGITDQIARNRLAARDAEKAKEFSERKGFMAALPRFPWDPQPAPATPVERV